MKILIDENLPVTLKLHLKKTGDVFTVSDMQWNSLENGELLASMRKEKFHCLITSDKNIFHQQNIGKYEIRIIILKFKDNRLPSILPHLEKIKKAITISKEILSIIE